MGIHSGPVSEVKDVTRADTNIAGTGINMAQRVMDCGDAGHILVSDRVAGDLGQYREWSPSRCTILADCEVKHKVRLHGCSICIIRSWAIRSCLRNCALTKSGTDAEAVRADEGFWVAVLPFKYSGSNSDLTALAEGLTEEIVTGLSRFLYLKVIARGSTSRYANDSVDVRSAGKEMGARYVMEGSLRQAGTRLRLTVQLVDAVTGAHLWAESYERTFSPETFFELQDDLVPRIVSTVADQYGALVHSMSESLRGRSAGQYSAHEAVLRACGYWERQTPEGARGGPRDSRNRGSSCARPQ